MVMEWRCDLYYASTERKIVLGPLASTYLVGMSMCALTEPRVNDKVCRTETERGMVVNQMYMLSPPPKKLPIITEIPHDI